MLAEVIESAVANALSALATFYLMKMAWPWGWGNAYDAWWCAPCASVIFLVDLRRV